MSTQECSVQLNTMLHHTNRCFLCSNGYPTRQSGEKNHSIIWQGRTLWTSKGCAGSVITISPHSRCPAITEIWKAFHEKEQTSRNLGSKEWSVLCFISNHFLAQQDMRDKGTETVSVRQGISIQVNWLRAVPCGMWWKFRTQIIYCEL